MLPAFLPPCQGHVDHRTWTKVTTEVEPCLSRPYNAGELHEVVEQEQGRGLAIAHAYLRTQPYLPLISVTISPIRVGPWLYVRSYRQAKLQDGGRHPVMHLFILHPLLPA
jgi:hypothetical protein